MILSFVHQVTLREVVEAVASAAVEAVGEDVVVADGASDTPAEAIACSLQQPESLDQTRLIMISIFKKLMIWETSKI